MQSRTSYWESDSYVSACDLIIVGGGLTGMLSAFHYIRRYPNKKVRILESGPFPFGASTRNAGFACFGSPTELLSDLEVSGYSETLTRLEMRIRGLEFYRTILPPEQFDYQPSGGYEVFRKSDLGLFQSTADRLQEINELLAEFYSEPVFTVQSVETFGMSLHREGFFNSREGMLHPGKLCMALEKLLINAGVEFRHGVSVSQWNREKHGFEVLDQNGMIWKSEQGLITTNGLTRDLLPEANIYPARGQVIVTAPIPSLRIKGTFHLDEGYWYFRNIGNRLLLGGGRHLDVKAERTAERVNSDIILNALVELMGETLLPGASFKIDHQWAGTMAFGQDNEKTPVIERLSERCVVAARLGGMGVAMAPVIAGKAIDLIGD